LLKKVALSLVIASALSALPSFAAESANKAKAVEVYNNALIEYKNGNVEAAKLAFEKAIILDSDLGAAHYNLALLLFHLNQYDEAIDHFREAVRIDPNDEEAKNQLGQNLCYRGKKEEGIPILKAINPSSSAYKSAQNYLAQMQGLSQSPTSTKRDALGGTLAPASQTFFNSVLKKLSDAWNLRSTEYKWNYSLTSLIDITIDSDGKCNYSLSRSSRNETFDRVVMDYCKKTPLSKPPSTWNPEQTIRMTYTYKVTQGKPQSGLSPAVSLFQKGMDTYQKSVEQAIPIMQSAVDADPKLLIARTYLGAMLNEVKRDQEAAEQYREILKLEPNDEEVKFGLAKTYYTYNDILALKEVVAHIPQSSPHYTEANNLLLQKLSAKTPAQQQQQQAQQPAQSAPQQEPARTSQTTVETVVTNENTLVKDKWALVIGISKFANPEYNLKFAAKDAQDFYNYLITDGHFQKDHVLLLLNERATRRNIMSAFGDKFLPAVSRDGDLVTIYISTHGTPASKDPGKRNFIIAYDTEAEALYETGVDMDELYRRVKEGVKTERALIVMDTCYSGAGVPGARGVDEGANFDASQLALGSGHLVMTSSSPSERSWESKVTANGVFTKYLIQNLKLTKGNVKNSFDKLKGDVGWEVQNAFNQSQNPQMGGEWKGKDLILNAMPTEPRPVLNPDLLKLMNPPAVPSIAPKTVPGKR